VDDEPISNLDVCTTRRLLAKSKVTTSYRNTGHTMLSTDKIECWVLSPDDRVVGFHYVHYFVNANGGWHCLLCDAGPMLMNRVRHHRNGSWHSSACKELKHARSVFKLRIEMLGHELWQRRVEGAMSPVSINSSGEDRIAHYFRFVQTLERYEQMERLSLLELAIWKANCIAKTTAYGVVFSTMREIDDYWALESSFDQCVYRQQKRITSGATVIIESVLPFLHQSVRYIPMI
jgi:hypothetical protein